MPVEQINSLEYERVIIPFVNHKQKHFHKISNLYILLMFFSVLRAEVLLLFTKRYSTGGVKPQRASRGQSLGYGNFGLI